MRCLTTTDPYQEERLAEADVYLCFVVGVLEDWRARGWLEVHHPTMPVMLARYHNLRRAGLRPHNPTLLARALRALNQNPKLASCVIEALGGVCTP